MHTVHSDGMATHEEIAEKANKAGLDFVIVTDHNVHVPEAEGHYDKVLLLVGEEVHDRYRVPESSHLLVFGAGCTMVQHAHDPQHLIDMVDEAGGICFLAHPYEHSAAYSGEPDINWRDWHVQNYTGLELWNTMSEFKSHVPNLLQALIMVFFPDAGLRGPHRETLTKWDKLLSLGKRVAVIGGPDAHGTIYRKGPLVRPVLSYDWLFQAVRVHILCEQPLNGDRTDDAALILDALQNGKAFISYDWIGDTTGFRFAATDETGQLAITGDGLHLLGSATLSIVSPQPAHLRLIRNGKIVAEADGDTLEYTADSPGAYRVEAYKRHWFRKRGWIFTNPIYISDDSSS